MSAVVDAAQRDAEALVAAGFDGIMVENFGDAPFAAGPVEPVTVAAMTRCVLAVRSVAPTTALGINVLRNDAHAALSIAKCCDAQMVRINVHVGARVTDQGVITGRAHDTLRTRARLRATGVALLCDVAVKHSAAISPRPIAEEARETAERGLADALLVTGTGTGHAATGSDVDAVLSVVEQPVYVASGVNEASLLELFAPPNNRAPHGVIVGSCLRTSGRAGDPIDASSCERFAAAFRRATA